MFSLFLSVALAQAPAPAPAPPVRFLRVVVLDVSTSMQGDNIRTAKAEILENATQLPPSAEHPLLVIPFHDRVDKVHRFTDLPALEAWLRPLEPKGGTSIASGLREALKEIKAQAQAAHVCVLLYTDGEDNDQKAIDVEERRLDQLFADRGKQGLKQTVVFAKRWARANAQLVRTLSKSGHARVIDAGELRLVPLTFTPAFQATQVSWDATDRSLLHVTVGARIDVRGADAKTKLAPLQIRCLTPGATGDTTTELVPGTTKALTLRLPVDLRKLGAVERVEVLFQLSEPPPPPTTKDALYLPLLPVDRVRLPVDLPPVDLRSTLKGTLQATGAARWSDALTQRAAVPLTLTFDMATEPAYPWRKPVELRLTPGPGQRLRDGPETITLKGPGPQTVALTVEATAPAAGKTVAIELTLALATLAPTHQFQPEKLQLRLDAVLPPVVTTTVHARTLSVSAPEWTDLARGTAAFSTQLEVRVDGPLAPGTTLTLRCPAAIRDLRLEPATLATGVQTVTLHVQATLRPQPATTDFTLPVVPPPVQGAVLIAPPTPWRFRVEGPRQPHLHLWAGQEDPGRLLLTVADDATGTPLPVVPVLRGLRRPDAARGLNARIRATGALQLEGGPALVAVNGPTALRLLLPATDQRSFFQDTLVEGELTVAPASPDVPVVAGTQRVSVRVEAPFKRLLFYLSAGIAAVLAVFCVGRLAVRLSSIDDGDDMGGDTSKSAKTSV